MPTETVSPPKRFRFGGETEGLCASLETEGLCASLETEGLCASLETEGLRFVSLQSLENFDFE